MVADCNLNAPPVDIKDSETQEAESEMALPWRFDYFYLT